MFFRFAYLEVLYILMPLLLMLMIYRWRWYKATRYNYPLAKELSRHNKLSKNYHSKIFYVLRTIGLLGLALMAARPQMVDEKSIINVDGVDTVIAIDVSGSMQLIDDLNDKRNRFKVAQAEAIRYIEKRSNDPIGIVIFANDVLSYAPITLDKIFLKEKVGALNLGFLDPSGTWLGTGLATAVNRLKNSKAKSKVVILLTDGEPSPEKIDPSTAIDFAKKYGIKIYTIGIGNERGSYFPHPMFGLQKATHQSVNKALLQKIATETGGMSFLAQNPQDMRTIYNKIDMLEKTSIDTNIFHNYYELFISFIWIILLIIGLEFFLRLFIWRGIF